MLDGEVCGGLIELRIKFVARFGLKTLILLTYNIMTQSAVMRLQNTPILTV
jgi:hypothetical protein